MWGTKKKTIALCERPVGSWRDSVLCSLCERRLQARCFNCMQQFSGSLSSSSCLWFVIQTCKWKRWGKWHQQVFVYLFVCFMIHSTVCISRVFSETVWKLFLSVVIAALLRDETSHMAALYGFWSTCVFFGEVASWGGELVLVPFRSPISGLYGGQWLLSRSQNHVPHGNLGRC